MVLPHVICKTSWLFWQGKQNLMIELELQLWSTELETCLRGRGARCSWEPPMHGRSWVSLLHPRQPRSHLCPGLSKLRLVLRSGRSWFARWLLPSRWHRLRSPRLCSARAVICVSPCSPTQNAHEVLQACIYSGDLQCFFYSGRDWLTGSKVPVRQYERKIRTDRQQWHDPDFLRKPS